MPVIEHVRTKCPKCGGTILVDQEEVFCVNCGYRPPVKNLAPISVHNRGGAKW